MGASCCTLKHDQANTSKFLSDHSLSFHMKSTGGGAPPAQLSLNQISSSIRDVRYIQQPHGGQIIGLQKSDLVLNREHRSVAVTPGGSETQGARLVNIIKKFTRKSLLWNVSSIFQLHLKNLRQMTHFTNDMVQEPHRDDSLLPITDDEDFCPTCLDGYDEDNPKIITQCKHHYHLSCILEWMERSKTCPICDQEMVFDETN